MQIIFRSKYELLLFLELPIKYKFFVKDSIKKTMVLYADFFNKIVLDHCSESVNVTTAARN